MSQQKMQKWPENVESWPVTKLLIRNPGKDLFKLIYDMSQFVYVFDILSYDSAKDFLVASVKYPANMEITNLIQKHPEYRIYRIFKSALICPSIDALQGFALEVFNNLFGICPSSTFYIASKQRGIRNLFYKIAKETSQKPKAYNNPELEFPDVKFDYDTYDYSLHVIVFNDSGAGKKSTFVVTYVNGFCMQNSPSKALNSSV
jgi:hypothetical protein